MSARSKQSFTLTKQFFFPEFRGGDWDSGGTCNGEKEPIMSGAFLDSYPQKMMIVDEVIRTMKFPVVLLNATRLTNYRKDGHPSIYRKTPSKKPVSSRRQDCSHWCLPGVPDAWNELIYASLVMQQRQTWLFLGDNFSTELYIFTCVILFLWARFKFWCLLYH